MCSCDGPRPDIYESLTRKANKQHTCCECGEPILVGEHYELVKGLWDGSWGQYKTCSRCVVLRDLISTETDCCLGHGDFNFEISPSDFPGLIRTVTVADSKGAYTLMRANACSLSYAKLQPKLYGIINL